MPGPWYPSHAARRHAHALSESGHAPPRHESGHARGPCLYEIVLKQAIATQHGLAYPDRLDLRACEDCGKPYLIASVWQPLSEDGEICCPRCGAEAVSWDGARGYVAYWQRDGDVRERPGVGRSFSRAPAARSS